MNKERQTIRSFLELRNIVDRMQLIGALGGNCHLKANIPPELAEDPHVIMLLTWLEMQNA